MYTSIHKGYRFPNQNYQSLPYIFKCELKGREKDAYILGQKRKDAIPFTLEIGTILLKKPVPIGHGHNQTTSICICRVISKQTKKSGRKVKVAYAALTTTQTKKIS